MLPKNFSVDFWCLLFNRDQHLYSSDPLYVPDDRVVVTETQVIRETLW